MRKYKSFRKAQVGAFICAILVLAVLAVPFSLVLANGFDLKNASYTIYLNGGKFDFKYLISGLSFFGGNGDIYNSAAYATHMKPLVDGIMNIGGATISSFAEYIKIAWFYSVPLLIALSALDVVFLLIMFIFRNAGFFRVILKLFSFFLGFVGIALLVVLLAMTVFPIVAVLFLKDQVGIVTTDVLGYLLQSGVHVYLLMFIFACAYTSNHFKMLARKELF